MSVVQREFVLVDLWNSKCIENEVKEEQVYSFNVTLAEDPISKILIEFRFSIISLSLPHEKILAKINCIPFLTLLQFAMNERQNRVIKPIKPISVTLC